MMPMLDQRNEEKEVWKEQPLSSSPTAKRFSSTEIDIEFLATTVPCRPSPPARLPLAITPQYACHVCMSVK
jgi:hypothetical protein